MEALNATWKLQYFDHLMQRTDSLGKTLMLGKIEGRWERRRQRMRMAGQHHQCDGLESSPAPQFESISSSVLSLLHGLTLTSIHDYWKTITLTRQTFIGKVMSLLFNMLSKLVITFFQRVSVF